jgi:hypothetical protein
MLLDFPATEFEAEEGDVGLRDQSLPDFSDVPNGRADIFDGRRGVGFF